MTTERPDCSFYRESVRTIRDREVRGDGLTGMPQSRPVPYCTHKHSPLPLSTARRLLTPGAALTCGGVFARCPLKDDQFLDM